MLLFGGLLFTATLRNLLAVDAGFDSRNVAVARVDFSSLSIPQPNRAAFTANVLERIRQIPGVISAAEVRHVPLGGTGSSMTVEPEAAGGNGEEHGQDQRRECRLLEDDGDSVDRGP